MSIFDRGLLFINSLFIIFITSIFIMFTLGWTTPVNLLAQLLYNPYTNRMILLMFVIFLLTSFWFLIISLRSDKKIVNTIIQENEFGQVRISLTALENIVSRVTYQTKGVKEVKPRIFNTNNGIGIFVEVLVAPDLSIPVMSNEIQNSIRDYLDNIVGLTVNNIRIYVQNISTDGKARVE